MINKDPDDVRSPGFCCVIGSILAMENQHRRILNADVVIMPDSLILKDMKMGTVEQISERLFNMLGGQPLTTEGVACKVLAPHEPWRKGRVRLVFEFLPDEEPQA